jgi:hypothetical protein
MKETAETIALLKKLGFVKDEFAYYSDKSGWGFRIESMPSFNVLLSRLKQAAYNDGYDDSLYRKTRKYGQTKDR